MSTRTVTRLAAPALALMASLAPAAASAQVFGTFPWQMQPYCNVVTLTLTTTPAGFVLDGVDDQCGAANKASAVGVGSFNGGGNVTLNFTIVTAPSGKPVHVSVVASPANGNGTWTDSVGNNGTFAFFGAVPGLPARPLPISGLAPSVITTTEIAAGAVGASDINTAEVQARVTGTCAAGQTVSAINANGTVTCVGPTDVRFRMRELTGSLAVASGAVVSVNTWGQTDYNVGGGTYFAASGQYIVPVAGTYLITTSVRWQAFANTTNYRCVWIDTSNAITLATNCDAPSLGSFSITPLSTVAQLTAGTTVRVQVRQTTGAAATVGSSLNDSHFAVTLIR